MHSSPDVPLHTTVVSCPLPLIPVPGQQLRLRSLFLQTSLNKLLEALGKAEPFFIRCIRSNAEKVSGGHRVWGAGLGWHSVGGAFVQQEAPGSITAPRQPGGCMSAVPALRMWRLENLKLKIILGYIKSIG